MKYLILYLVFAGIFLVGGLSDGKIQAESEISIDADTDKNSYEDGQKVVVSGTIKNFDSDIHSSTALTYRALDPEGSIVSLGQTTPNSRGFFSFNFDVGGSFFNENGSYPIQLYFATVKKEISFIYDDQGFEISAPENNFDSSNPDEKIITLTMNGQSTFYLDSPNKIIRAFVEVQNYTPSDGQYFMKVIHVPTTMILQESVIYPANSGNDLWTVQIAYPILDSDLQVNGQTLTGEFEIHVRTEFDSQTASTTFYILESSTTSTTQTMTQPDIPDWIKNPTAWWTSDKISETEFLMAIEYLIQNNIMDISSTQNENIPSITSIYSLPSSRSTQYAEITGVLPDKHEGPLTLTVIQPDKSEQTITTISRDGSFMTTMPLTSESLQGQYQIFAEIEGDQILVSAFSVKGDDSSNVPTWVKNNADSWAQNLVSDDDFVEGIQYLVQQRIIIS